MQKELQKFQLDSATDGLVIEVVAEDCWHVKFSGAAGTIYEGENYTLQVKCKKFLAVKTFFLCQNIISLKIILSL